ncbi:MAG: ornithine carbamoyltransferase [Chloroflexi bacterium]|jgi:N-acetylornithine carbamoyltransferase|nr:ornithine carbamoyltransferase [Chloroflexota bacterium]
MQTQLYGKDFITTEDWTNEELETALDMATDLKRRFLAGEPHDHLLRAKTLYMLFFEESTRTRTSFETGMTQLGGHGVFLTPKATQIDHGENAQDTGTVLSRYGHGIAVRDCRTNIGQKYLYDLAKYANIPIFSMQDDVDHPCQTMADLMTMREKFGDDLRGRKFVISWTYAPKYVRPLSVPQGLVMLMTRWGMDVTLAHPPGFELMPHSLDAARAHTEESGGAFEIVDDMDAAFEDADVCYAKSWGPIMVTEEEQEVQSMADENISWKADERRMALAKKNAIYMHCMPVDRGYEATDGVIDGPQSVIYDEAENRLHIQKALMVLAMGGRI